MSFYAVEQMLVVDVPPTGDTNPIAHQSVRSLLLSVEAVPCPTFEQSIVAMAFLFREWIPIHLERSPSPQIYQSCRARSLKVMLLWEEP